MPYRLLACLVTSVFLASCADGAGDHASPLMIFAGQIAQGSVGSNSETLSAKSVPKNRQGKIAANNPEPTQDVPLATDFGQEQTTPVAAPPIAAPETHPDLTRASSGAHLDTPW